MIFFLRSDAKRILAQRERAYYNSTAEAVCMFVEQKIQDRNGHA